MFAEVVFENLISYVLYLKMPVQGEPPFAKGVSGLWRGGGLNIINEHATKNENLSRSLSIFFEATNSIINFCHYFIDPIYNHALRKTQYSISFIFKKRLAFKIFFTFCKM